MLAFIDESGQPHPNDSNAYSTLLALCMQESDHRELSRQLYGTKRALLPNNILYELKAVDVLNRRSFRQQRGKWELAEQCFALFGRLPLTAFAIVMPRPSRPPDIVSDHLPHQHIFLLQRVNALAKERNEQAVLIYDGQGMNIQGRNLSACISNYIFRVAAPKGQMEHVLDTAFFVDSRVTPGIQVADLAAGALRLSEQHRLAGDEGAFESAIRRYASVVVNSTRSDLANDDGRPLNGIQYLREDWHYERPTGDDASRMIEPEDSYTAGQHDGQLGTADLRDSEQ